MARNSDPVTLTVSEVGAKGDGIARIPEKAKPYYVALAAPGDHLIARPTVETADFIRAEMVELVSAGPDRRDPPCPHYGPCGGCQVQHLTDERYLVFKSRLIEKALRSHGVPTDQIRPMMTTPPGSRRRATLFGRTLAAGPVLGFLEAASHRIVDIGTCPLLTGNLNQLLPILRESVLPQVSQPGETLTFTLLDHENGVDLTIGSKDALSLARREWLASLAETQDLSRLAWQDGDNPAEPVAERRPARLTLSGIPVAPPPAAFTQATAPSETTIACLVADAMPPASIAVDLFSGIGTLSFAAIRKAKSVTAIDGAEDAIRALRGAADAAGLGPRVRTEVRNLALRPLLTAEMKDVETLIFDPPRAGAKQQAAEIASSSVPLVIAVSCNPQTFARDARLLCDGGYRLNWVQPIDQFLWSFHCEIVAVFSRSGGG